MDTWRDISNSLSVYLRGRLVNPIFGAYLVAWSVINFRLLLVLLGEGTWQEKIGYIDTRLFTKNWDWFVFGYAYPMGVAVVLVLGTPFINRWTTVFLQKREAETTRQVLQVQGETPMSKAEAKQLRLQRFAERQGRLEDQEQAEQLRAELTAEIDVLLQENKKLKSSNGDPEEIKPQGLPSDPAAHLRYEISESDLIGIPQRVKLGLTKSGVTHLQAAALYAVRNETHFGLKSLARVTGLSELHSAMVLIDQLNGLGLIEAIKVGNADWYRISSAGRQALHAIQGRGFEPMPNGD